MRHAVGFLFLILGVAGTVSEERAASAADTAAMREMVNSGTVGLVGGSIKGTYARFAWDLSAVLDDGYDMRVLPINGKGSVQNIEDLLFLRGVDIAIVQSDVLDFYKRAELYPNIEQRIHYITKLYNEELHLLARDEFTTVDDLIGRRVNFGPKGGGTFMTAGIVFDDLGIDVEVTSFDYEVALEKLRQGEIDALLHVAGKPVTLMSEVTRGEGLHLLSLPADRIKASYVPTEFSAETYPELVPPGEPVPTVAVGAVMAAYNWPPNHPRRTKVNRFMNSFSENFDRLLEAPYHPKWQEVDLQAEVPGWQRMTAAQVTTQ